MLNIKKKSRTNKINFNKIVSNIRIDYETLRDYYKQITERCKEKFRLSTNDSNFITDVFLDKAYEISAKLNNLRSKDVYVFLTHEEILNDLQSFAIKRLAFSDTAFSAVQQLDSYLEKFIGAVEHDLASYRKELHKKGLIDSNQFDAMKFVDINRKRYLSARDSISLAKKAYDNGDLPNVFTNMRTSIERAICARFGFNDIKKMKDFFTDAEEFGLPLPSYDLAYTFYDEGSKRSHKGKVHTELDCLEAINFASTFIDRLDLVNVTEDQITKFKAQSKTVQ